MRLGIIGLGHILDTHLQAIDAVDGIRVAGVCDRDANRATQIAQRLGVPAYGTLSELLASATTDAILIALPHALHCDAALQSLAAGQHVIVEKPMAIRVDEVRRMLLAARAQDRVLLVAESAAANPGAVRTGEHFAAGDLGAFCTGSIVNARFYFTPQRPGWFLDTNLSGGGMFANVGMHRLAIARTCLPGLSPRFVSASVRQHPAHAVEACTSLLLRYHDGGSMLFEEVGYHPVPAWFNGGTHFVFEEGLVSWDADVWRWQQRSGEEISEALPPSPGYRPVYQTLVSAAAGIPANGFAGADFGMDVVIVQAAYESSAQQCQIDLHSTRWRLDD